MSGPEGGLQVAVITGVSGAGKSTAVRALEDEGYFCIDNLPVPFLQRLVELLARSGGGIDRVALVVDAREGRFLEQAPEVFAEARRSGVDLEVVYLDAADEAILRRFSETRRRHPLAPDRPVLEGVAEERTLLAGLRRLADHVIDTSRLSVHELRDVIHARFGKVHGDGLVLTILSFGFRYGIPPQSDLVLDVRFLANPYFVDELKGKTGRDRPVVDYVLQQPEAEQFLGHALAFCGFLLPHYRSEGKSYLTLSIGCTGGKHRSVVITHELARRLQAKGERVRSWDRDLDKE
ncbi:MAG TPA: RNase adapter RapZ [Myxococcales bacterium]|nr:RNase adapter RapZ [Myxococcales bacterium]